MCVKKIISVPVIKLPLPIGALQDHCKQTRFFITYENYYNGMSLQNKFQINYFHPSLVVWRHRMFSELVSDFLRATVMAPCISFVVYTLVLFEFIS